jgi:hypothetical protein
MQKIPEFSNHELKPAVQACVETGVAKISDILTSGDREKIYKRIDWYSDATIPAAEVFSCLSLPSLQEFLGNIDTSTFADNSEEWLLFFGIIAEPVSETMSEPAHIDSVSAPRGVSLLLPLIGGQALFGASHEKFDLNPDVFTDETGDLGPAYIGEYGLGDGMLVRQSLKTFNGAVCDLPAIWHCGAAATRRHIVALDVVTSDLVTQ